MKNELYFGTVSAQLRKILKQLMRAEEFEQFRLVGGTALSLQIGHRLSVDIDLFTDADYKTINFEHIDSYLKKTFKYIDTSNFEVGMGKSYFIGDAEENSVKLDIYYTDKFIKETLVVDGIRMATTEEIIAMKVDVVLRGGRKKDFWDLHELIDSYSFEEMLNLHKERNPHSHNRELIKQNFTNFKDADDDFEPDCLKGKHWEIIKLDLIEFASSDN